MRSADPELLPRVWSDLIGEPVPGPSPEPLEEAMGLDRILWAAYRYARPRLRGSGNRMCFAIILFQTGVVAALYERPVARAFLTTMTEPPRGWDHFRNARNWRWRGAITLLTVAEREELAPGVRLPKASQVAAYYLKDKKIRKALLRTAIDRIQARFEARERPASLGWEFASPDDE